MQAIYVLTLTGDATYLKVERILDVQVGSENEPNSGIIVLPVTLPNADQFSYFFYRETLHVNLW